MSKLEIYVRPLTIFEAENKEHRRLYASFLRTGSWTDCPYRWAIPDDVGNLQGMIQRKLLDFYMGREFKSVAKEPQIQVRQKKRKNG